MKTSKIVSLILAMAVLLAFALPMTAFAAGENATITIKPPNDRVGLAASDFSAYKLYNLVIRGDGYVYTAVQPAVGNFLAWAETVYDNDSPYGADADEFLAFIRFYSDNAAQLDTLAKDLMASGKFTTASGTAAMEQADPAKNVVISGLDYGYYMVIGKGTPTAGGDLVIAHNALVSVHQANTDITLKADAPSIAKTVSDTEGGTYGKLTDVNIGDEIFFKITSVVPNMARFDEYTFIVHDKLSVGLSLAAGFDEEDVAVTIGGASFDDFTVAADGQKLTITFGTSFIKEDAGDAIVIAYAATLNEDAVMAPSKNTNEAYIEYSNDPYWDGENGTGTGDTPPDEADVYTFDIVINKIDGKDNNVTLSGAEFTLAPAGSNDLIKFIGSGDGNYRVATPAEAATTTAVDTLVSPDGGQIKVKGLEAGTYTLTETKAPAGYNLLGAPVPIVIANSFAGGVSTYVPVPTNVENNAGGSLPGTGGIGTTIFYAVSAILTIGLVAYFVIRKRRNLLTIK